MKVLEKNDLELDFDHVWEDIKKVIEADNVIFTLARKRPNTVLEVSEAGLLVQTKREPKLVKKEWIKAA